MGWSIGYDDNWQRDIGYGVPAYCDEPGCDTEIHRGLSYVCCNSDPYGGEDGCGRFFCPAHERPDWNDDGAGEEWRVCGHSDDSHISPDHPDWNNFKLTDESWAQWRKENSEWVAAHKPSTV